MWHRRHLAEILEHATILVACPGAKPGLHLTVSANDTRGTACCDVFDPSVVCPVAPLVPTNIEQIGKLGAHIRQPMLQIRDPDGRLV